MEFLILPHQSAKKLVEENPYKLNVICAENELVFNPNLCNNFLHLKMDDIQDWHIEQWDKKLKERGILYPEKKHVIEAIQFDKKCNHKIHIIYCHAGISRSPAVGYAVLRGRGWSKKDAMKEIMKIQPYADPNKRIVRITDELFGK